MENINITANPVAAVPAVNRLGVIQSRQIHAMKAIVLFAIFINIQSNQSHEITKRKKAQLHHYSKMRFQSKHGFMIAAFKMVALSDALIFYVIWAHMSLS
jgi:hypothetical protein